MSITQQVEAKLQAIAANQVEAPSMPVAVGIQEAVELEAMARKLWPQLEAVGAQSAWLDELHDATHSLRELETEWTKVRFQGRTQAEQSLVGRAESVRTELLAATSYALRNDASAQARITQIREGDGMADLIQDLHDLAALAADHQAELRAIHFDMELSASARLVAEELSHLKATTVSARVLDETKVRRDRAWTYLTQVVDSIRAAGLFALRNDTTGARLAAFRSRYAISRGRRYRNGRKVPGTAVASPSPVTA